MPTTAGERQRFTNPLIDHDVPDPDVIALSSGGYALVASSFDRAPGLPLWHSDDLMQWRRVGFAGGYRADAPHDGGVWAPSIREHGGRMFITWGDPDIGIFVTESPDFEGPWSEPRLLQPGQGLIDACPYWDEDGRAWIVHGYARSRAGFANRIDIFEADAELTVPLSASRTVIDGDSIDGCDVLEGPKVYRRDGELWIFAPAGGVATGWQYAFRATSWDGSWDHRIVLEQGDGPVNGPHQGAWVIGEGGEEWFFHFQSKGHLGRVLHMQPLHWGSDGWPIIGDPEHHGIPVLSWITPHAGMAAPPPLSAQSVQFEGEKPEHAWHVRDTTHAELVLGVGESRLTLAGHPEGALLQPLQGTHRSIEVAVLRADEGAAFVVADASVRELVMCPTGDGLWQAKIITLHPDAAQAHPSDEYTLPLRIGVRIDGDTARFTLAGEDAGEPFVLMGRRWTGTEWGIAARGGGSADFGRVEMSG